MFIELFTVLEIMVETIIGLIPYGLIAMFPTMIFTRLATASWRS